MTIITIMLPTHCSDTHPDYWECACNENFVHQYIDDVDGCIECGDTHFRTGLPKAKLIDVIQHLWNTKEIR